MSSKSLQSYIAGGMAILTVVLSPVAAHSDTATNTTFAAPLRIGAHVPLDDQWARHASDQNQNLVKTIRLFTQSGDIDALPNNRLFHLYRTDALDCILSGGWPEDDQDIKSRHELVFEVHLFTRANVDLTQQDQILIGRLKQFAPPDIPLGTTMVDWLPLQTIDQGFDLLIAGRIDAMLADPSHISSQPAPIRNQITAADIPPVKKFTVPLLCHNTEANRDFIHHLDQQIPVE